MIKDRKFLEIIENVKEGMNLTKEDCVYLLKFKETSLEASILRAVANDLARSKHKNSGVIIGQIGAEISGCTGDCKFCIFGKSHARFNEKSLTKDEIIRKAHEFADIEDLYGIFIMGMHTFNLDNILESVEIVKKNIPEHTQIWVNVGDADYSAFRQLKQAGVRGAYHVCRLREGIDTSLQPSDRMKTMESIISAGLDLYTCCEPVGPEHSVEELVDNFFIGIELGCFQHAAMRRIAIDGVPLGKYGQITELRLAQIVATITLATLNTKSMRYTSVHEPNTLGLLSGANVITAETGANPRDIKTESSKSRGFSMGECRKMLWESGFTSLRRGDESMIKLDIDYLNKTDSFK